jgi:hypothetical protein
MRRGWRSGAAPTTAPRPRPDVARDHRRRGAGALRPLPHRAPSRRDAGGDRRLLREPGRCLTSPSERSQPITELEHRTGLVKQVQSACDSAKFAASRLTGKEAPAHPPAQRREPRQDGLHRRDAAAARSLIAPSSSEHSSRLAVSPRALTFAFRRRHGCSCQCPLRRPEFRASRRRRRAGPAARRRGGRLLRAERLWMLSERLLGLKA